MKKLLNLLLAMLAVCGISCEPNDLVGGKTTFAISVTNITTTGATIDVVPSNNHTYYYFDVVQKIYFEEYATPTEFAYSRIEQRKEYAESQGVTLAEALSLGAGNYVCNWLTGNKEYYAYAFGITPEGELCTDVAVKPFTTLPYSDAPSANTFGIEVSDISAHGAKISVTPSNDDYYYFYAIAKAEYEAFESEAAFAESVATRLKEANAVTLYNLSSGPEVFVFDALLKPNTDYYAYAFGLSGNYVPTTGVTKVAFKTLEDTDNVTTLDYFDLGYVKKYENRYADGTATWFVVFFAQDEANVLTLEFQTPNSATNIVGEYEISSSLAPGSLVAGALVDGEFRGSYWSVSDENYNLVNYKLFQSGSVNVSKTEGGYTITIDALDHNNEKVVMNYNGPLTAIDGSLSAR